MHGNRVLKACINLCIEHIHLLIYMGKIDEFGLGI